MEKLKRYVIFVIGLFINSLGVSFVTKASLGTSPISSIPYVLSLNFPFTLGQFTILFSLLLIVIQLVILRRNFKPEHILQIPISVIFGYFIDVTMALLAFIQPQNIHDRYRSSSLLSFRTPTRRDPRGYSDRCLAGWLYRPPIWPFLCLFCRRFFFQNPREKRHSIKKCPGNVSMAPGRRYAALHIETRRLYIYSVRYYIPGADPSLYFPQMFRRCLIAR